MSAARRKTPRKQIRAVVVNTMAERAIGFLKELARPKVFGPPVETRITPHTASVSLDVLQQPKRGKGRPPKFKLVEADVDARPNDPLEQRAERLVGTGPDKMHPRTLQRHSKTLAARRRDGKNPPNKAGK